MLRNNFDTSEWIQADSQHMLLSSYFEVFTQACPELLAGWATFLRKNSKQHRKIEKKNYFSFLFEIEPQPIKISLALFSIQCQSIYNTCLSAIFSFLNTFFSAKRWQLVELKLTYLFCGLGQNFFFCFGGPIFGTVSNKRF